MKTVLFFISLLCFANLYGQKINKTNLQIDFGATFSLLQEKHYQFARGHSWYTRDYRSSFGYVADIFMNHSIGRHFELSFGIEYYQNRYHFTETGHYMVPFYQEIDTKGGQVKHTCLFIQY